MSNIPQNTQLSSQRQYVFLPKWITSKAIGLYFALLIVVSGAFMQYALPWYYMLAGVVGVFSFFYVGNLLSKRWVLIRSSKRYEGRLFWIGFIVRLVYVVFIYTLFQNIYGDAFGFEFGDALFYDDMAQEFARQYSRGNFHFYDTYHKYSGSSDVADMGYALYLGFIYWFTGNSILISRIIKCILSAFTAVLVYRLAKRNFGEQVARLAGLFCMLWPNFWYYCGTSLKETEMVFLVALFVEQADQMFRSKKFTVWKVVPILLIAGAIFFIRTPLAIVTIMALLFTITMSSTRVVNWSKRIIIGVLAISLVGVTMGNRIQEEASDLLSRAGTEQKGNMEWRSTRANGNRFAKYAGAAVFAPLIFTIPFPTMVDTPGQDIQKLNNGSNYAKNVMSGILIFALFSLLLSGEWREHMLPLSLMLGYIVVLVMSSFAQSERFHQPAMPFAMMFSAYGISLIGNNPRYKRWFNIWLLFIFVVCVGWQWFKLRGRGM